MMAPGTNLSTYADHETASTREECVLQRIEHLSIFGARTVLELCVGPSLRTLDQIGSSFGMVVTGNDIDPRWAKYYPQGRWIIGDALTIDLQPYDAVVFAPPLSRGCSGRREDALTIEEVVPSYEGFLRRAVGEVKLLVLVLPGRSLSTVKDRQQLHKLLAQIAAHGRTAHVVPLTSGGKKLTKYVDIYLNL